MIRPRKSELGNLEKVKHWFYLNVYQFTNTFKDIVKHFFSLFALAFKVSYVALSAGYIVVSCSVYTCFIGFYSCVHFNCKKENIQIKLILFLKIWEKQSLCWRCHYAVIKVLGFWDQLRQILLKITGKTTWLIFLTGLVDTVDGLCMCQ